MKILSEAVRGCLNIWLRNKEKVIKFLGENPGACPWDEAKKYFSKSLMSISSEYNRSNSIKGTFN